MIDESKEITKDNLNIIKNIVFKEIAGKNYSNKVFLSLEKRINNFLYQKKIPNILFSFVEKKKILKILI